MTERKQRAGSVQLTKTVSKRFLETDLMDLRMLKVMLNGIDFSLAPTEITGSMRPMNSYHRIMYHGMYRYPNRL